MAGDTPNGAVHIVAEQVNFPAIKVTMLKELTIAAFRASLRGGLIEPSDPGYDDALKVSTR